jgi:hypothetical protein
MERLKRCVIRRVAVVGSVVAFALLAPVVRADVATWGKPGMDVWIYPDVQTPGVRTLGPTFLSSPGLDENDQFLPGSSRDPARRGMTFAVFKTEDVIETGLPQSYYHIKTVTVTFSMQESSAGPIFYDDTPDTNAELLADYVTNDIDTARPMELYGIGLNAGFTGFNFGAGDTVGGAKPFVETRYPFSPSGAAGVLGAYPIAADESGSFVDVSNSLTGGFSATAENGLTAPFDPVPWSIGKVDGLAPGDMIPEHTTFEFNLDLDLPGVTSYVQSALAEGALGFYLSSNHFSGDPHNGGAIPYPQWYHKEFNPAFGGVAPTLAVEYEVLELPGDYNVDGVVDAADYSVWRDRMGSATALANDDTLGVADDDYLRWKSQFGKVPTPTAGGGAMAQGVPEPATVCLLLFGVLSASGLRRRAGFPEMHCGSGL